MQKLLGLEMSLPARNHRSVTTVAYRARTYLSLPLDLLRSRARYSQSGATSEAAAPNVRQHH